MAELGHEILSAPVSPRKVGDGSGGATLAPVCLQGRRCRLGARVAAPTFLGRRPASRLGAALLALTLVFGLAAGWASYPTLGEALNAPDLVWQTRGWFAGAWLTHDGTFAANCEGAISPEGSALETVVAGPGVIEFWWYNNFQKLAFTFQAGPTQRVDYDRQSPEPWQFVSVAVPSSLQTVSWTLSGGYVIAELPFAAVDEVLYEPVSPPVITVQPQARAVAWDQPATFAVTAAGEWLIYQWHKAGTPIAGATNATYAIAHARAWDAGLYSVLVSNLAGCVTSSSALLRVLPCFLAPTLTNGVLQAPLLVWPEAGTVVVESSTDLARWTSIQTNPVSGGGCLLALPIEGRESARFFRAQVR
jgi:hypothetical protein